MKTKGVLYLIPNVIAKGTAEKAIPAFNKTLLAELDVFICEHVKELRALLKEAGIPSPYDHIEYFELNKHTDALDIGNFIKPLQKGKNMGLVSDAGCPGIADPGAQIVALAHRNNIKVVPLIGPSSLVLALMASGFNGQKFSFHGYLPQKDNELKSKLAELERRVKLDNESQLFIEAPYRNKPLFIKLCKYLNAQTKLCVAYNLNSNEEQVLTKTIVDWKQSSFDWQKEPCVFILGL
jgi:16S rRNA (cytidine1402-2'-O)-methyltransferase